MSVTEDIIIGQSAICQQIIEKALTETQALATLINRGPGGRETALTITKLQEALFWLKGIKVEEEEKQ